MPIPASLLSTTVALGLLGLGAVFVFAPEVGAALTGRGDPLAFSLLGAALVGLGVVNWMTRRQPVGGIYGRPIVAANLAHFVIGGLALLRVGLDGEATGWTWALAVAYLAGAACYGVLLFGQAAHMKRAPS